MQLAPERRHFGVVSVFVLTVTLSFAACSAPPPPIVLPTQTTGLTLVVTPTLPSTLTAAPSGTSSPAATSSPSLAATNSPSAPPSASSTSSAVPSPSSSPSTTPLALLAAPQLLQPGLRASYSYRSPVILTWTWQRSLGPGEYFDIQFYRDGTPPADFACTAGSTYQIDKPPSGYGWYLWRVLVRRGQMQGNQCTSEADVSQLSESRNLEWREPPQQPTPKSYP